MPWEVSWHYNHGAKAEVGGWNREANWPSSLLPLCPDEQSGGQEPGPHHTHASSNESHQLSRVNLSPGVRKTWLSERLVPSRRGATLPKNTVNCKLSKADILELVSGAGKTKAPIGLAPILP